jgi:glutamyl/glutaminyl-tRNA synthetase
MEYAQQGYLPEAMVNFLALLGWSPGSGDRELFSRDELMKVFDLSGISGSDAVFNPEKLDWFNQQHLFRLAPDELARRLMPSFSHAGIWSESYLEERHAWFFAVLELLRPRAKRLDDFATIGRFFFVDQVDLDPAAVQKHLTSDGMGDHLVAIDGAFAELPTFDAVSLEAALRTVADARRVKAATLIHAVRVAVTGKTVSPGLFEVVALVGRERTHGRLLAAARLISTGVP